jgi:ubiquinol oxidase
MKVLIRAIVSFFVFVVDVVYGNRSYARFYVLETIARVPYFSYLSVLHLYETLGYWRKADWLKVHFAETWNELHHLLIMESLGGNRLWIGRWRCIIEYERRVFGHAMSSVQLYSYP